MDQVLHRLFAAENDRDWETLTALLDPAVTWFLVSGATTVIRGRDDYVSRLQAAYEGRPAARFRVERFRETGHGRTMCELVDDVGRVSVEVFDVRDGLLVTEWEFPFGSRDA
ncbi:MULTISPECIES: nuclear transport factor 2 family protein [unclassified Microbacterium]|uniref:nuclear transport factor 2 family protein n=1 Tax=unclassified Microbacterium TaxID=2609290 RepID=UPI0016006570|nr:MULTISPECIES: nuclear transport factor 2 family protein [unclassified Microbacterium]MBT2486168.1 nuclear transport factor 2 family protein [Microbacterium sp. ISL-108]